jgi:tetratricopeptide (TPR) repeat protein
MNEARLSQLKEMLAEDPNDVFVDYAIGLELYKLQAEEGILHLQQLAKKAPNYCPVHFKLGQWFTENDQEKEALNWFYLALEIAKKENDTKAINEIKEAIWLIEE